jgi:hypothetical protein
MGAPPAGVPAAGPSFVPAGAVAGAAVAGAAVAGAAADGQAAPAADGASGTAPAQAPAPADGAAPAQPAPGAAATGPAPKTKLPGVKLAEGEYPIAVESPGMFFWMLFVIFCLLVVTLPLALWMMLGKASKRYIITNRRSIRVKFTGKVLDLPHDKLDGFKVTGFMGGSNVSLLLKGKGAPNLAFGLCGPMGAMARLWGVLYFWVLNPEVDVNDAPAVDANNKRVDEDYELDILLFDKTQFRRGLIDMSGAMMYGAAVITPNRFMWLRTQSISDEDAAELPVYSFIISLAKRMTDMEAFEAEVERVAKVSLAESVSRRWENLVDPKIGRTGLVFEDKGQEGDALAQQRGAKAGHRVRQREDLPLALVTSTRREPAPFALRTSDNGS